MRKDDSVSVNGVLYSRYGKGSNRDVHRLAPVKPIKFYCVQCRAEVKLGESREVGAGLFKHKECRQTAHISKVKTVSRGASANFKQQLPTGLTKRFNSREDGTSMKGLL